jgi:ADP-heptose:LPS heptosyltransferase
MKIDFMRWCDRWLGKPAALLVWLISPLLRATPRLQPGQPATGVQRIVVIKFFGMGSLLLGTPAFRALKETYPAASLEIITSEAHGSFIQTLGIFDRVHGVPLTAPWPFARGILRVLLAPRPDISINLEYYTWSVLALQTLQRSRVRAGFAEHQWLRRQLLDIPVYFNHRRHIRRIFGAVAEALGARVRSYDLSPLAISENDRETVRAALARSGYRFNRPLIAVHIGASPLCPLRQWPLDNFRRLLRTIIERTTATVVLAGGPEEKVEADLFSGYFAGEKRLLNLVGALSIPATIALLEKSSLLITNDSGLLHWAVAVNTPTISFFGPETPQLYGPPPEPRHRVFYSRRYCSPCMTTTHAKFSECRDNACLKDIGPDEVFEAVVGFLELDGEKK